MNDNDMVFEFTHRIESAKRLLDLWYLERAHFIALSKMPMTFPHVSTWIRARQETAQRISDIEFRLRRDREWLRQQRPIVEEIIKRNAA